MNERDDKDMFLILGRLEGKLDAFGMSQTIQDERIKELEEDMKKLFWKVAAISGSISTAASWFMHPNGVTH